MANATTYSVFRNYSGLRFSRVAGHYGGRFPEKKAMAIVAVGLFLAQCDSTGKYFQLSTDKNDEFDRKYPDFDKVGLLKYIKDELIAIVPTGNVEFSKVTHDERYRSEDYNSHDAKLLYIFKVRTSEFGGPERTYVKIGQEDDGIIYALSFHEG